MIECRNIRTDFSYFSRKHYSLDISFSGPGRSNYSCHQLLFQNYLPEWQKKRATRRAIQKYSGPIRVSANRLFLLVSKIADLPDQQSEEINQGTLYELGSLLGWIRILQSELTMESIETSFTMKPSQLLNFYFHVYDFLLNLSNTPI
jgi:hypothetical protein